jgi:1-acyl-sn-glycerol-3-phosphate acyltransferase
MLILASPHTSLLDGPALSLWLGRQGFRQVLFAVDPDYARHALWRPLLLAYGWRYDHRMVAVDSRRPFGLRSLLRAKRDGWHVALFPQGIGISEPDRPWRPGADWLVRRLCAENAELQVVRVALDHDRAWPRCAFAGSVHPVAFGACRHA